MCKVLTYGTFDLLHVGHVRLLNRAKALGTHLTVAVSTDDFNDIDKCKKSVMSFTDRAFLVKNLQCVDKVIAEHSWEQKVDDIISNNIDVFVMGSDWEGKFDFLKPYCDVRYLPRTENISTTCLKQRIQTVSEIDLRAALT